MRANIKSIKYIFYQPGVGGNFLQRLFSLSPDTQFLWRWGTCGCRPKDHSLEEKLKYYSYNKDDIQNWMIDAHRTSPGSDLITDGFSWWERNPTVITCQHFYSLLHLTDEQLDTSNFKYNYIDGVTESFFYVEATRDTYLKLVNNVEIDLKFQEFVNRELEAKHRVLAKLNLKPINLDKMLMDDQNFLEEYQKICSEMNLEPIDSTIATEFFNAWKSFRWDRKTAPKENYNTKEI